MGRAERIELGLRPLGEAGQPVGLAQGADALAPAGQDLVGIALVTDVPDHLVARRVEHVVEGPPSSSTHAQSGAQMAAGHRYRVDRLRAQLVGDLLKVRLGQPPQIGGRADLVQQRRPGCPASRSSVKLCRPLVKRVVPRRAPIGRNVVGPWRARPMAVGSAAPATGRRVGTPAISAWQDACPRSRAGVPPRSAPFLHETHAARQRSVCRVYRSGSGMNSSSPGTAANRPAFQSALASSIRSFDEDTKFHQI